MTNEPPLPEPPEVASIDPELMTASELRAGLEKLFGWLHSVEAAPENGAEQVYGEDVVQNVRDAANQLLDEQRERHSDETAPRGG